jgi:carboxypeptidase C (cathepsin A)
MLSSTFSRFVLAIMVAGTLSAASAEDVSKERPQNTTERHTPDKGVLRLLPTDSVTEHAIDTPRGKVAYTATAGTLAFFDQSGEQSASVFYTAYVLKNGAKNRPLTFVFNGGPGAASAFLHLDRTAGTPREQACATTLIRGSLSRISC